MNIVIVTATSLVPPQPLGVLPDGATVRIVASARAGMREDVALIVAMPEGPLARAGDRIARLLQGNVAVRMIQRISPLDAGARFWRAVRRDARVDESLTGADLLIAGDRDATFACWHLARRMNVVAVSGYAAGKKEMLRQVSG